MPIHIYNPPAPHSDPINAGLLQQGQRCGNCICVARMWLLICKPVSGVYSAMGGSFALNRDIASAWKDPNQTCRWACDVPLGNNGPNGVWSLSYESGLGFWQVWADMSANAPADIVTYLPNAITAQPKSPEGYHWVQDNWKCLGKNTLPIAAGGLGFPPTVQVQPLWA